MPDTAIKMLCTDLTRLPEPLLPEGYTLAPGDFDVKPGYNALCRTAFGNDFDFAKKVEAWEGYYPGASLVILAEDDSPVAAATGLCGWKQPTLGYLHYVVADPGHWGKRLGYTISLCCLRVMAEKGMTQCRLDTDTFRRAAVTAYLRLGFLPLIESRRDKQKWVKWRKKQL